MRLLLLIWLLNHWTFKRSESNQTYRASIEQPCHTNLNESLNLHNMNQYDFDDVSTDDDHHIQIEMHFPAASQD